MDADENAAHNIKERKSDSYIAYEKREGQKYSGRTVLEEKKSDASSCASLASDWGITCSSNTRLKTTSAQKADGKRKHHWGSG